MSTNPITSWHMKVAREFGATVIGLSDKSEQKLAALIEKHDPHAETVRLLEQVRLVINARVEDWVKERRGFCAMSANRMSELEKVNNEIHAYLATLKGTL